MEVLHSLVTYGNAKEFLNEKCRFLPDLVNIFKQTKTTNEVECLLVLLQKITQNVEIKIVEPFLEVLIIELIKLITNEIADVSNHTQKRRSV